MDDCFVNPETPDQINKHTVEGYLENRSIDRALHLLTVGDELQKISVMKNLATLIKDDMTACMQRIIPRMQQTLPHGTTEYNMGACEAIRTVAQQNLMSTDNFTKVFLHHILNSLDSRDTVAAEEWLNTLLDIIQVLPVNVLQSEVLPIAVSKAHISKPVHVRLTSCRILGRLALSFTPFLVKKDIVPVVISLCQDVSGEVRAAMTSELPNLSATLGLDTSTCLMTYILDLNLDEDMNVREAIIEAIAHMLPRFPPDVLKTAIISYTKRVFPEIMKNENNLLLALTKFYGQYSIGLRGVMTVVERGQFLQRYIQLSQLNSNSRRKLNPYKPIVMDDDELALRLTECRLNCAFNLPAMVLFSVDLKQELVDSLFTVFHSLASDSFCQVRRKIAAGFFEVMKLMPKWHAALKVEFVRLLKDEIDIVLEGLVPNISNILLAFSASNTLTADKTDSGKDVGQALFICEKNLSEAPHWRLYEEFLLSLRAVPKVFHPEFVYLYFVPLLMTRAMNGRILPCRVAALHTLLVIVVDPSQSKQKPKIRNKILELCNNSSFHCRLLFLRGMSILLSLSPEVMKELFFHNTTSMSADKVANIRLVVCTMLPRLKALATEPLDRKLLAGVDAALASLSNETDRDVIAQLKIVRDQMDDLDRTKGIKRPMNKERSEDTTDNYGVDPKTTNMKFQPSISLLTNMRSFIQESSLPTRTTTSQYSVAQSQRTQNRRIPSVSSNTRSVTSSSGSVSSHNSGGPARSITQRPVTSRTPSRSPDFRRPSGRLTPDEFLVDAGIPLKSTSVVKRIPTPRPVHRPLLAIRLSQPEPQNKPEVYQKQTIQIVVPEPQNKPEVYQKQTIQIVVPEPQNKPEAKGINRRSLPIPLSMANVKPPLTPANKNLILGSRTSNLPLKKTSMKPLSCEEIEKELLQSDVIRPFSPRMSQKLKPSGTLPKKENNRLSLDSTEMSNYHGMELRSSNINKRYSLDVDSKKEIANKKSLSCINNNTLMSPKPNSRIVRPQSCVLQTEKVNHSKRSMSVENLPPKVTRLTSRLPVRSSVPKTMKPK